MNINNVSELASYQDALNALGFSGDDGVEQFLGVAQAAGPELAAYLGIPVGKLNEAVAKSAGFGSVVPQDALDIIYRATYTLGVPIDHVSPPDTAPN
jgi:hypothetical protein